jgi:hypothetical protein
MFANIEIKKHYHGGSVVISKCLHTTWTATTAAPINANHDPATARGAFPAKADGDGDASADVGAGTTVWKLLPGVDAGGAAPAGLVGAFVVVGAGVAAVGEAAAVG